MSLYQAAFLLVSNIVKRTVEGFWRKGVWLSLHSIDLQRRFIYTSVDITLAASCLHCTHPSVNCSETGAWFASSNPDPHNSVCSQSFRSWNQARFWRTVYSSSELVRADAGTTSLMACSIIWQMISEQKWEELIMTYVKRTELRMVLRGQKKTNGYCPRQQARLTKTSNKDSLIVEIGSCWKPTTQRVSREEASEWCRAMKRWNMFHPPSGPMHRLLCQWTNILVSKLTVWDCDDSPWSCLYNRTNRKLACKADANLGFLAKTLCPRLWRKRLSWGMFHVKLLYQAPKTYFDYK